MNDVKPPAEDSETAKGAQSDSLVEQAQALAPTNPDEALALAQKATDTRPSNARAWYVRGMLARSLNRHGDAVQFLAKATELEPGAPVAWLTLAEAYAAAGQPSKAVDAYRQVTRLDSANREAWLGLSSLLASGGRPKEAADALIEGTRSAPGLAKDPEVVAALASCLVQAGQYTDALTTLKPLDALPPNDEAAATLWFWRGRALQGLGENQGASEAFERAAPNLPQPLKSAAFYLDAVSLNELPLPHRALQAVAQAESSPLDAEDRGLVLIEKGKALLAAGDAQGALGALIEATTRLEPGVALSNCWLQIGVAHNAQKEPEQAVEAFDHSLATAPAGAEAAHIRMIAGLNKAVAENQLQRPEKALAALDVALADFDKHPGVLPETFKATLLVSRANMLTVLRRFDEARAALVAAEAANPGLSNDLQFWVTKTNVALFAGHPEDALAPPPAEIAEHPLVMATRGAIQNATGNFTEGQNSLRRAADCAPNCGDDPLKLVGAGLAELTLYQWQAAADTLQKARQLSPMLASDFSVGYSLAVALLALERYKEAWAVLEGLPDTNDTLQAKATALEALGNGAGALRTMERVTAPDASSPVPSVLSYWLWRGNLMLAFGRFTEALEAFGKAIDSSAQPAGAPLRTMAAAGKASALIRLGQRDEALAWLAEFTAGWSSSSGPRPGSAWWLMGALLAEKEQFEDALRAVNLAQALEPNSEDILLSKGRALLNLEDYQQAEVTFEQAWPLARKEKEQFEALVGMGAALNGRELCEKAIERFRQALSLASEETRKDSRLWFGLGEAYRSLGRTETALRTFQEGWRLSSMKSVDIALALAGLLLDEQRDREARDFLASAHREDARDPRVDLSLGVALYRLKDNAGAQAAWQRAKKHGSQKAAEYLESIPKPTPDPGDLLGYWFGDTAPQVRRVAGAVLVFLILIAATLPIIGKDAIHWLRWLNTGENYKMGWITLAVLLLAFLAPILKSIKLDVGPVKLEAATPDVTAKPNVDLLLEKLKAGGLPAGVQSAAGAGVDLQAARAAAKASGGAWSRD
jgi:tetratricopeptide (TPR) repeat protein